MDLIPIGDLVKVGARAQSHPCAHNMMYRQPADTRREPHVFNLMRRTDKVAVRLCCPGHNDASSKLSKTAT